MRSRILRGSAFLLCCLLLAGCAWLGDHPRAVAFTARYIDLQVGYRDDFGYPQKQIVTTKEQLDNTYAEEFVQDYNEDFFKSHCLVVVYLAEPTWSIDHEVTAVTREKETLNVYLKRLPPAGLDGEMERPWLVIVELPSGLPDNLILWIATVPKPT